MLAGLDFAQRFDVAGQRAIDYFADLLLAQGGNQIALHLFEHKLRRIGVVLVDVGAAFAVFEKQVGVGGLVAQAVAQ